MMAAMEKGHAAHLEDLAAKVWPRLISEIDELALGAQAGVWSVPLKTSLAADDQRTKPFHTSHAVHQCLVAGIDNLSGLRHMIFGAPGAHCEEATLHHAAHYLLARGAIENFATALWILDPSSRSERVTRTLRWHAQNIKDMHAALAPLPVEFSTTTREEKFERLEQILRDSVGGVPARFRSGYTTTEVVEYVDDAFSATDSFFSTVFIWRLCSGFAHGRPWASIGFLEQEELVSDDPEVVHTRMKSDLPRALMAPQHALELCGRLLATYRTRSTPIDG